MPGTTVLRWAVGAGRRDVVLGTLLVAFHQAAEVLVPVTIGVVIDRAVATGDTGAVVRWLLLLAALFVVLSAAGCTGIYVEERTSMTAAHRVRTAVARRLLHPAGGAATLPGEAVSLATVDATRVGEGVGAVIIGIGGVTGVVAGAVVLLATSWWLGLVVLVGVPVVLLAVQAMSSPMVSRADAHQEAVAGAAGVAADLLRGLRVLKGLGAEGAGAAAYRRRSATALGAALAANRIRAGYTGTTLGVAGGFVVVVAWLGGRLALDGTITVGQLVAALGVTQFLLGPFGRLALTGDLLARARASSERLDAVLHAEPAVAAGGGTLPTAVAGGLRVRGLCHGTLDGLDLVVAAGEHVGVVAADPADAAALVACLDRSADPAAGTVEVDGVALPSLTLAEARRAVVVAHHEAPLFEGTLAANVAAAAPAGCDLDAVLAASGADEVAAAVGGPGTALTEEGRSLSGGQRQRVALARALATGAPVLVVHEPTTAVDAATEHRVAAGLRRWRQGRTTLVVATSPALLAATDRVVVVRGGRVVAEGTHAELAGADPTYRAAVLV